MGFKIGKGVGVLNNIYTNKFDLCLIGADAFCVIESFECQRDARTVFSQIAEIQALTAEEVEILRLYHGTSETMRTSIRQIMEVTQNGNSENQAY